jgi:hypothetical protein
MLFRQEILDGIAAGRVTLAFRRWRRAPPVEGGTLLSPVGLLRFERVTRVDEGDITPDDVRRTGMTLEALRASIAGDGTLLRIELRRLGDDPRLGLRADRPGDAEADAIVAKLPPWAGGYLRLIGAQPAIVSRVLAPQAGAADLATFKRRVRQLKGLGLTESLEVGYRLSPRGEAVLRRLDFEST